MGAFFAFWTGGSVGWHDGGMIGFLMEAVPHDKAAGWLRGKVVLGRAEFDELAPELKGWAFTCAGLDGERALERAREACAAVPEGGDWEESREAIKRELMADDVSCFSFLEMDALGGDERESVEARATRQAELVLRMNVGQAYAYAKTAMVDRHADIFTHKQYLCMEDDRVRPEHAALHGLVLPAADPFWSGHTPPWDFNCRCTFAALMASEVEEIADGEADLAPEESSVLDEGQLEALHRTGRLVRGNQVFDLRTPRQRLGEKGYEWDPRQAGRDPAEVSR